MPLLSVGRSDVGQSQPGWALPRRGAAWKHVIALAALAPILAACGQSDTGGEPQTTGGPALVRRLTQEQYRHIIADVFGPDIHVAGRMDPDIRKDGLLAIGATEATFTPGSFEQYDGLARAIAADVLSEQHRKSLLPCAPASDKAADAACARATIKTYGRLLFRRSLTDKEVDGGVALSNSQATKFGNFYRGLEYGVAGLLESPSFLFQADSLGPDPDHRGKTRLTAYSKASRLSFYLWDSGPDDMLLTAAEKGELDTKTGLKQQADRMLASPRLADGLRGLFSDYLQLSQLDSLAKDSTIYPRFSLSMGPDVKEQALRTITELLVTEDGDFRDLFTTRKTFMNRALGVAYQVPVPVKTGWMPYEFPAGDPRGAGLLTLMSFTAQYALPGRSSPTLRGKAIREIFLCEPVPPPPANVDFSKFENGKDPTMKTARERLDAHHSNPACAGCHLFIDPMGLTLENFDGLGTTRDTENGATIDASGQLDSAKVANAAGLGQAMHDSPQTAACFVNRSFAYGAGRMPGPTDKDWMKFLQQKFAEGGYKVRPLLEQIVTSDNFYRIQPAGGAAPGPSTADKDAGKKGANS